MQKRKTTTNLDVCKDIFSVFTSKNSDFTKFDNYFKIKPLRTSITLDIQVRIEELQKKIRNKLGIQKQNISFEFHQMPEYVDLDLMTTSPIHKQSFLLHSSEGRDKIEALELMLKYVNDQLYIEDSYTIQWKLVGSDKIHQSYFRAKNIMDALDKFYFGRSVNSVITYSVELNPIS